ncbi:2'-5'-oligoadenylate synthase-like protein 2 [Halichondria panicea]|uniref:2'-5'-oligoadenylate synthase-like protein 2 n=1 Tax=Halichondria panicea TaxID=6063 RepID=UPI00312B6416
MAASHAPNHTEAEKAIGELVLKLQTNLSKYTQSPSIRVNEIVKAGSMGHGTAVPEHFDIDLVLYSSDVNRDSVNRIGYESYLKQIRAFITDGRVFRAGIVTNINLTRYAVQFQYEGYIDVDLLVSPVWWGGQPKHPRELFEFLRDRVPNDAEARHKFSVNASKWQVAFMKKQDSSVKQLIIRAKAWRNQLWQKSKGGRGRPSSYLLTLLVLHAYKTSSGTAKSTTQKLKEIVRNHRTMNIYWENYYNARDYPTLFPSSTPRLVDPANPANNVYQSGIGPYPPKKRPCDYERGDGDWSQFVDKVEHFDLEKSVEEITR